MDYCSMDNVLHLFSEGQEGQKKQKRNSLNSVFWIPIQNKTNVFHVAMKIHQASDRVLFLSLQDLKEISFEDWPHLSSTTFFIKSWSKLTSSQKEQMRKIIFSHQTSPDLKIIIGLEKGDKEWMLS